MIVVTKLTPSGRGAIAVVSVEGPGAIELVARWFEPATSVPLASRPLDRIGFGRWLANRDGEPDPSAPGEELLVVRTAPERLEVHCHGGEAASAAIVECLVSGGAVAAGEQGSPPPFGGGATGGGATGTRVLPPPPKGEGEFSSHLSLEDQARAALAMAPTERVAGVLLDQLNGALERAVGEAMGAIEKGATDATRTRIDGLLAYERLGSRLLTPWRVVLAGPPNVGKSSLINALVGYDRAIVYDRPGTTRDVVTAQAAIDGWPVTFADTAGVRDTSDRLEAAGVELAREELRQADVLVLIDEATGYETEPRLAERARLRAEAPGSAGIVEVASKIDLRPDGWEPPPGVISTNAPAGAGVAALIGAIGEAFRVSSPPAGAAVPFHASHFTALRRASEALACNDIGGASATLQSLLSPRESLAVGSSQPAERDDCIE